MEDAGKIDAILRAQAVIEFNMGRHDHYANENLLKTMGYSLAEIQGRHHSRLSNRRCGIALNIENFGPSSTAASTLRRNTSASARAARKSGSWPATIQSLMNGKIHSR
jgi:hypothetical protein